MKLLFDVDGVVADTRQALLEAAEIDKDPDPSQWDLVKVLSGDERERAVEILNDHNFWRGLPLKDGAKKVIQQLKDAGHQIVWVTSPWKSCFGWRSAREDWLAKHFSSKDHLVVTKEKQHVSGDVFVDDKVKNVEAWKKANPNSKAFIFDAPNNRDYHDAPRLTWDNALEKLL